MIKCRFLWVHKIGRFHFPRSFSPTVELSKNPCYTLRSKHYQLESIEFESESVIIHRKFLINCKQIFFSSHFLFEVVLIGVVPSTKDLTL